MAVATAVSAGTKFGRTYQLSLVGRSNPTQVPDIDITFPTTLEFDVTHNIFAAANTGNFSLYGLSETNRSEISFSTYLKSQPYPIVLRAGYLSQQPLGLAGHLSSLPVIFNGFCNVAYTERSGPELVTRINAFDNGDITSDLPPMYFNGTNAYTAPIGTPFVTMVKEVMLRLSLNGVQPGSVVINPTQIPPPVTGIPRVFSGRVWENLETLASEAWAHVYIENGVCNMLGQKDFLPAPNSLPVLQSSTGLLNIPKYTDSTIICSCIFEPSFTIGAQIQLNSTYLPRANGPCRIVAYTHHGTISGVNSGNLYTDVTLMKLGIPFGPNP